MKLNLKLSVFVLVASILTGCASTGMSDSAKEALESGTVHLVGTCHDLIIKEVSTLLDSKEAYEKMSKAVNPYGDGKACSRIVSILKGLEK